MSSDVSTDENPLSWWGVSVEIDLAVEREIAGLSHPVRSDRAEAYRRLGPRILADHLRSGRDVSGLLADMVEEGILKLSLERLFW